MDAYVNGVATAPNAFGAIIGTSGSDRISGTTGNDKLHGGQGVDYLYGGAGNDTFGFKLSDFDAALGSAAQDFIYDFSGAGMYLAGDNDFLSFTGFGAGSTLTLDVARSDAAQAFAITRGYITGPEKLQYYVIHSAATGQDYEIFVKSMNGNALGQGDYNFY
ncbi:hypothetical protein ACFQS7_14455 [Dankookia sp. GCM10030260]|uniref:hypothetical protein n=1 Tax=Dankookia sp. GCM10030260 TaxID=3273390 RepID=UPI003613C6B3